MAEVYALGKDGSGEFDPRNALNRRKREWAGIDA